MSSETIGTRRSNSKRGWVKSLAILVVVAALVACAVYWDGRARLQQALEWTENAGAIGPVVFTVLYILACVLFLPGSILTIGAGLIWGVVKGSILVSVASTLGAIVAFLVGRYAARDWIAGKIAGNESFAAIDEAVAQQGWKIVGLTRLSPIFPFNLLNYAYGVTKVSLRDYALASWIGMLPGTVLYVYIGTLGGQAAKGGASAGRWTMYIVGFLATIAVTVVITRIARKALRESVPGAGQDPSS